MVGALIQGELLTASQKGPLSLLPQHRVTEQKRGEVKKAVHGAGDPYQLGN